MHCTFRSRSGRSAQDADGVTVSADDLAVRARRVIVAIPLAIATSIDYEPMLPVDRAFLHQRMPSGAVFKISIIYDEPFWRADGLSGQSAAPDSPATLTIDACTDTADPGIMCVITEGPAARRLGRLDEAERKAAVIGELVDRFGSKARTPVGFHEQNWTIERYSGGGMLSHAPHRSADRIRLHPARAVRSHALGRDRELGHHVRVDRRCHSIRGARRGRGDGKRRRRRSGNRTAPGAKPLAPLLFQGFRAAGIACRAAISRFEHAPGAGWWG